MKIKAIVTDMDCTLLNKEHEISERNKKALIEAQQKGIKVVLASGRSYDHIYDKALDLELDKYGGYIICDNGGGYSKVADNKKEVVVTFGEDEGRELFNFVKDYQVEIMVIVDGKIYLHIPDIYGDFTELLPEQKKYIESHPWFKSANEEIVDYTNKHFEEYHDLQNANQLPKKFTKMAMCSYDINRLRKVQTELIKKFEGKYNTIFCSPEWLEVNPRLATKGKMLRKVAAMMDVELDEIMVFGDSENDASMFRIVKNSVAVANAMDVIHKLASDHTDHHDDDGVANYLYKTVLK
ncbi:MAG: Cof-type HAD-IIB family hydrolase [Erysipelotrichaceae bacterium]